MGGVARQRAGTVARFVSVILPVYNDARSLEMLLRALDEQDYPRDRFECLVVDNGSDDPIRAPLDCGCDVRVIREPRPGSYAARNRGISEARGDVLAFTDVDCIPRYDWLSSAVRQIGAAKRPVMMAGQVELFCPGGTAPSVFEWHNIVNDLRQTQYLSEFHFAATANMIATREAFERVGGFDAALLSGGDFEWGQRAWSVGIEQVYSDSVVVRHPARTSWRSLVAKIRRVTGGHYTLERPTGHPMMAVVVMILKKAPLSVRRSWRDPRLPTLSCRLRVIAIDLALRFVQLCEVVRLGLGGQPRRH